jgi:hypothetical protein
MSNLFVCFVMQSTFCLTHRSRRLSRISGKRWKRVVVAFRLADGAFFQPEFWSNRALVYANNLLEQLNADNRAGGTGFLPLHFEIKSTFQFIK